jgi:haloalkane dehalogenase
VFADGDHRIHFIDEGEGAPILLPHGNPTWSFL